MKPFWTWRPGCKWCDYCGRYRSPHRHWRDMTRDEIAADIQRAFLASAARMAEVKRLTQPTPEATERMRELGITTDTDPA